MGAIIYQKAEAEPWPLPREVPRIYVQMVRPQDESVAEIWYSSNAVRYESTGTTTIAHDGEYLFVATGFTEKGDQLEVQTERLYLETFRLLDRLAYTTICRIWNYVPEVNQDDRNGHERYKVFCSGRSKAFTQYFPEADTEFSAATGIGSMGGDVGVVFLAKKAGEVIHLENPEQTPAYFYPEQYGPRSPSFARATYARSQVGRGYHIFVSGTASVIGYESVHQGDITRQVETSIDNINTVVSAINLNAYGINSGHGAHSLSSVKVYIRHERDFATVKALCERHCPNRPIAYLHADICRSDLDVEIEGVAYGEDRPSVPATLRDYFTLQTARNARKPAYIYLDENGEECDQISFLLLRHKVFNIASCLQRRFKKGDKLVLAYSPGIEFVIAYYACILSGLVVIPIPAGDQVETEYTLQKIQLVAETLDGGFAVLCDDDTKRRVGERSLPDIEFLTLGDLWDKHQKSFEFIAVERDDIATLWIASDSAGDAKVVSLSHDDLVEKARAEIENWDYTSQSVSVSCVPHYRYLGLVFSMILPICNGTTTILMAPGAFVRPQTDWLRAISHYRATHSIVATSGYEACVARLTNMQDMEVSGF
ncbi:AMP-binding protein [Pendulispora rubella]|uniref:AMP-binding protein n=1 Tax=Pendulispora rubella TaxID=2741070 RepID=A0ABZ2KVF3_9BACT